MAAPKEPAPQFEIPALIKPIFPVSYRDPEGGKDEKRLTIED
jgi:hypothetical protein